MKPKYNCFSSHRIWIYFLKFHEGHEDLRWIECQLKAAMKTSTHVFIPFFFRRPSKIYDEFVILPILIYDWHYFNLRPEDMPNNKSSNKSYFPCDPTDVPASPMAHLFLCFTINLLWPPFISDFDKIYSNLFYIFLISSGCRVVIFLNFSIRSDGSWKGNHVFQQPLEWQFIFGLQQEQRGFLTRGIRYFGVSSYDLDFRQCWSQPCRKIHLQFQDGRHPTKKSNVW